MPPLPAELPDGFAGEKVDIAREIDEALAGGGFHPPPHWASIPGGTFGGFVAAAALRVALVRSSQPTPISLHGRFFRPTPIDTRVGVEHEVEHSGRNYESHRVRFLHGGRPTSSFTVQVGEGRYERFTGQRLAPPEPAEGLEPVYQLLRREGAEPPAHMEYVKFEGVPTRDVEPAVPFANRWPAETGQIAYAAVMPIDNFAAPATWRYFGDFGPEKVMLPSLDIAAWFHDLDVPGGMLETRTEFVAASHGISVGHCQVWRGDRLVATGTTSVMAVDLPG